ncbi:hypothetical protein [Gemmata sp.]|uniref:hypothetical protein n=1 Tax=Gemmata sp. TaxID=1914242 RepID=UPI003F7250F4
MPVSLPRRLLVLSAVSGLLLVPFVAGCGNRGTSGPVLRGVVLKDGEPYRAKELGGEFGLSFVAVQPGGKPGAVYLAEAPDPATGAFEVTGPTGSGIPPGKYKIRVKHVTAGGKSLLPDELGTDATSLEITVTDAPAPLTIDLGKSPSVASQ